jgi:hypothetical protein
MRKLIIATCAAIVASIAPLATAEEAKKDAAEAVGEGNAARWLDYYRRERGEQWESKKPDNEHLGKPADSPEPREEPRSDAPAPSERR